MQHGKKTFKKLNVSKLKQEYVAAGLSTLYSKLECVQLGSSPAEDDWSALFKTYSTRMINKSHLFWPKSTEKHDGEASDAFPVTNGIRQGRHSLASCFCYAH